MKNYETLGPEAQELYDKFEQDQKTKLSDLREKAAGIWDNTAPRTAVQRQADLIEKLTLDDQVNAILLASVVEGKDYPIVPKNCEEREIKSEGLKGAYTRNGAITNSKREYHHILIATHARKSPITGDLEFLIVNGRDAANKEIAENKIQRNLNMIDKIGARVNKMKITLSRSDEEISEMKRVAILKRKQRQQARAEEQ